MTRRIGTAHLRVHTDDTVGLGVRLPIRPGGMPDRGTVGGAGQSPAEAPRVRLVRDPPPAPDRPSEARRLLRLSLSALVTGAAAQAGREVVRLLVRR